MGVDGGVIGGRGLDGWCQGGLGQQRYNGEGCTTMSERSEKVDSPGTYVTE